MALRQALDYVVMFAGKLFVIVPDPEVQKGFLNFALPDLELFSRLGIKIHLVLSNGAKTEHEGIVISKSHKEEVIRVACEIGVREGASKIIFLLSADGIHDDDGRLISSLDVSQARELLDSRRKSGRGALVISGRIRQMLSHAVEACQGGVDRVHFINGREPDALLEEVFTGDGCGTLLSDSLSGYEQIKQGRREDAATIAMFLRSAEISVSKDLAPQDFVLACKDDEILASMRVRRNGTKVIFDCIAIRPGLNLDECLSRLMGHVLSSEFNLAFESVEIRLANCQDWVTLSRVPGSFGFTRTSGVGWLLSK